MEFAGEQQTPSAEKTGFIARLIECCRSGKAANVDRPEEPGWYISCCGPRGDKENDHYPDLEQGNKDHNEDDEYKTLCCIYVRDTRADNEQDLGCSARLSSCCSPKNMFLRIMDVKDYILEKLGSPDGTILVTELSVVGGVITTVMWATPYQLWFDCSAETSINLQTAGGYGSALVLALFGGAFPGIIYGWKKRHKKD